MNFYSYYNLLLVLYISTSRGTSDMTTTPKVPASENKVQRAFVTLSNSKSSFQLLPSTPRLSFSRYLPLLLFFNVSGIFHFPLISIFPPNISAALSFLLPPCCGGWDASPMIF